MSYPIVVTLQEFIDRYYPETTTFIPFAQATYSNEDLRYMCQITNVDPLRLHENFYQWAVDLETMVAPCIAENGWATCSVPASKLELVDDTDQEA